MKKAEEAPAAAAGDLKRKREEEKDSDEETGFEESGSAGEICLAKERGYGKGKVARDRGDSVVVIGRGNAAHPGVSQLVSWGNLNEVPTISPASHSELSKRYASIPFMAFRNPVMGSKDPLEAQLSIEEQSLLQQHSHLGMIRQCIGESPEYFQGRKWWTSEVAYGLLKATKELAPRTMGWNA
ncbi:hypothetical protein L202_05537 [Cryptococcus amylolentus CBS 6039]|uniref:Uncharacterized protein n=2 Tax=Cryptococcus amylolentus TaxID=104669 RepID=A0A1E3HKW6_9TREE|nr:hypothetical protein L202_05537 [Cryptococcus amylolentus CBS 6039]ODN76974.1 hypothetical protein L202_05537 [Cryptococcus amylolentus CBS 6039]ODO04855.1 hypothetical protein I350_05465 [Cryptococcus amylolentus CBS 6273]